MNFLESGNILRLSSKELSLIYAKARIWKFAATAACGPRGE